LLLHTTCWQAPACTGCCHHHYQGLLQDWTPAGQHKQQLGQQLPVLIEQQVQRAVWLEAARSAGCLVSVLQEDEKLHATFPASAVVR
jgi:hypothetical protein